jgi:hypothetical protein
MHLALNMAKMAKGGISHAAIKEMEQLIKKPCTEVREEKKRGVEFPGHQMVKAAIQTHLAMVYKNQTDGCLLCQNGTAKNPQTHWRCKGTAAPPLELAEPPHRTPPPPRTPRAPQRDSEGHESYEIEGMPSLCVYIQSSHPNTPFFNHNAYVKDSERD